MAGIKRGEEEGGIWVRRSVWGVLAFLSPSPGSPSPFLQAKAAPSTQTSFECSPFVLVHVKTLSLDWIHLCQVMRMGLYFFFYCC